MHRHSATTSSRRRSKDEPYAGSTPIPKPSRSGHPRRLRDRAKAGEEDPRGGGAQPHYKAHRFASRPTAWSSLKATSSCSGRPQRWRQDAPRTDARQDPERPSPSPTRRLTEAGYVGEDVENIIVQLLQKRRPRRRAGAARHRLHRRDRQDLEEERQPSITRDVSGEGVATTPQDHRRDGRQRAYPEGQQETQQDFLQVDTTNILFICGGADGFEQIVQRRIGQQTLGFGAEIKEAKRTSSSASSWGRCSRRICRFGSHPGGSSAACRCSPPCTS